MEWDRGSGSKSRSKRRDETYMSSRYAPSGRNEPSAYESSFHDRCHQEEREYTPKRRPALTVDTSSRMYERIGPIDGADTHYEAFGRPRFEQVFNEDARRSPGPFSRYYVSSRDVPGSYSRYEYEYEEDEEPKEKRKKLFGIF
jgi:hypothetical protein